MQGELDRLQEEDEWLKKSSIGSGMCRSGRPQDKKDRLKNE
jgi:hypothetical protein